MLKSRPDEVAQPAPPGGQDNQPRFCLLCVSPSSRAVDSITGNTLCMGCLTFLEENYNAADEKEFLQLDLLRALVRLGRPVETLRQIRLPDREEYAFARNAIKELFEPPMARLFERARQEVAGAWQPSVADPQEQPRAPAEGTADQNGGRRPNYQALADQLALLLEDPATPPAAVEKVHELVIDISNEADRDSPDAVRRLLPAYFELLPREEGGD